MQNKSYKIHTYSLQRHCESVRLVSARSCSGTAVLVSPCHLAAAMCGGGVRTLWATPGAFSSDHSSSPRVTMEAKSSSSEHQDTEPPRGTVLSLERNRETLGRRHRSRGGKIIYMLY